MVIVNLSHRSFGIKRIDFDDLVALSVTSL